MQISITIPKNGHLTTTINHSEDCCGCLNGTVDEKNKLISFKCNECGESMGYISPIEIISK